jgi:hypothetical protein
MAEEAPLKRDDPVVTLVEKFKAWVQEQPEWLVLIQLDRHARRAGMKELASRLYTIATMDAANTVPRVVRRKAAKQLSRVANDLARKQVLDSVKAQEQMLLQAAVEIGRQQGEDLAMEKQAVKQQVQEMIESGEISPEAAQKAFQDQAMLEEARASVALDGETQAVEAGDEAVPVPADPAAPASAEVEATDAEPMHANALASAEVAFIESDETTSEEPAID